MAPLKGRAFILGSIAGLGLSSVVYFLFSFIIPSPVSDLVVSGITILGLGFSLGGYFFHWRGDNSAGTLFMTGLGVGIVIVAFLGAGAGLTPFINP